MLASQVFLPFLAAAAGSAMADIGDVIPDLGSDYSAAVSAIGGVAETIADGAGSLFSEATAAAGSVYTVVKSDGTSVLTAAASGVTSVFTVIESGVKSVATVVVSDASGAAVTVSNLLTAPGATQTQNSATSLPSGLAASVALDKSAMGLVMFGAMGLAML